MKGRVEFGLAIKDMKNIWEGSWLVTFGALPNMANQFRT